MLLKLFLLCFTLVNAILPAPPPNKIFWDYTILEVNANSSDESMIKSEMHISRIDRGQFGVSGVLTVNTDITDEFFVETKLYRSPRGSNNYQILPMRGPKQTLPDFMKTTYARVAMNGFANCSNLPQSIDGKPPIMERKVYVVDKCKFSMNNLPTYMPKGFMKLLYLGSGPVNYAFEVLAEIEEKN